jgi:glycerol-1-phosphate dehydrogenase [NAD(P)+]
MKIPFFSVPTAASVDGFVSTVAAMTWNGCKKSFTAVSPVIVVADTDIYKNAPLRLTASGVSDLLGKYTALADWKIAHLLTGEYICEEICDMEYEALDSLIASLDGLTTGDTKAYEDLMYGLLLSGLAMQMTGNSRPASGAEHHMSHFWEMEVLNEYIDFYHGEKVGVGLVLASKIYHEAAKKLLSGDFTVKESVELEVDLIKKYYCKPGMLESTLEENTPNLLADINSKKLIECKDQIAAIINEIPTSKELIAMLDKVNGVKSLADLGFEESFQAKTAQLSPYVRQRLTFMRLLKFFDFYEEVISC